MTDTRLSPLGLRLALARRTRGSELRILSENVPQWPTAPPLPAPVWDNHSRYAPSHGVEPLLDALREREQQRGVSLGTGSLLVTNGGLDGLGLVARHVVAGGARRALCAGPILRSVADLLENAGLHTEIHGFPTAADGPTWSSLDLGPSDLIYLNTPHNPTGACLDERAMRAVLDARRRSGCALVLDVVYDSFVHDPSVLASPLALVRDWDRTYAVNSFSKNYGVPGLRVGWLITTPDDVGELTARIEWERIAVSTEAQHQAAHLCTHGNEPLVQRVEAGRELALRWAEEVGAIVSASQGGTQIWLDLQVGDAEVLADELMTEHGLIIATGANYRPVSGDHIRLPVGADPALLRESLRTIATVRHRLRKRTS